jgi:hypothetical protein
MRPECDPPEYQPEEPLYSEMWVWVNRTVHASHGGWTTDQGWPVCACGTVIRAPEKATA